MIENIKGHIHIELCNRVIKDLAKILYHTYKQEIEKEIIITSGFRLGDKKAHGRGEALDFTVSDLHIHQYADIAYKVCEKIKKANILVTSFGMYEGIDPKDSKWKTHIHLDITDKRDFMSVYTGVYK